MSVDLQSIYDVRRTLGVRTELVRQFRRRRTLIVALLTVALPTIVVLAVKFGPSSSGSGGGGGGGFGNGSLDLVGLATSGAWNFTLTMMFFASGFLLTIFAAMFLGDAIASEASWSTLRYLLVAPVPRRRLMRTKIIVGLLLVGGVLLLLLASSLLIGLIAFGGAPLSSPLGGVLTTGESAARLAVIAGYILLTLLVPAGVAFVLSVVTDVPLGAVGGAVVIVIVLNILGAIEALGSIRRLLPTEYSDAWTAALAPQITWGDMAIGASYSVVLFAVLVSVAVLRFDRKDILS